MRGHMIKGRFVSAHISGEDNNSDILTKNADGTTHQRHVKAVCNGQIVIWSDWERVTNAIQRAAEFGLVWLLGGGCCEPEDTNSDARSSSIVGHSASKTPSLSMYVGQARTSSNRITDSVPHRLAADLPAALTAVRLSTQTIGSVNPAAHPPECLLSFCDLHSCVVIDTYQCRCVACHRRGVGSTPDVEGGSKSARDPSTLRLTLQEP